MKNLLKKMSSFMLVLVMVISMSATAFAKSPSAEKVDTNKGIYQVTIGDQTINLKEGERASIPLAPIEDSNSNSGIQPSTVFTGDMGTLELWVSGGRVYYKIRLKVVATSFTGIMKVTDISSGLSGGLTPVSGFSGSVPTSNLSGHTYSASLTGIAYFGTKPVATCVPNNIYWKN